MSFSAKDSIHPLAAPFLSSCDYKNKLLPVEIFAINQYVKKLVGYNLWDKFIGLYPFVGRSAALHSINLKSPGLYDIWWCGSGLTHNRFGVHGHGAGYGNTLIALNQLSTPDIHISVYNGTYWINANPNGDCLIGAADGHAANILTLRSPGEQYTYCVGADGAYYRVRRTSLIDNCLYTGGDYYPWIEEALIQWEDGPDKTEWNGWCESFGGSFWDEGYFGGEPANYEISSQTYGHIIGSNSTTCYIQGETYGNIAPNSIRNHSIIYIRGEFDNYSEAPVLLLRDGKFGTAGACSWSNIRMASVGYGLKYNEAKMFFEATQEFEKTLGRSVERIYLDSVPEIYGESILISESISNLKSKFAYTERKTTDGYLFSMEIDRIRIVGPRVIVFEDEPMDFSTEILSFSCEE